MHEQIQYTVAYAHAYRYGEHTAHTHTRIGVYKRTKTKNTTQHKQTNKQPIYQHTYIHADRQTDRPAYIHTNIHTYIHAYIYTYIYTCIHTDIHTYKFACSYVDCVCIYVCRHLLMNTSIPPPPPAFGNRCRHLKLDMMTTHPKASEP